MLSVISISFVISTFGFYKNSDAINTEDQSEEVRIARGIQKIKELEAKDVRESEEKIELVQSKLVSNQSNSNKTDLTGKIDYIDKFSNSVILGDSRAEGLIGYEILNNSSVVAYKGRNVASAISEGDLDKAINLSPQNIFITYGTNDVLIYGSSDDFIKEYEKLIKEIKIKLPSTKIYVNSIFRVSEKALESNSEFSKISLFNTALENMCKKLGITYIDGSSCVKEELYESDGIHFKPTFDRNWLDLLIKEANL